MSDLLTDKRPSPASRYVFDFAMNEVMAALLGCIVCCGFHVAPTMQFNIILLLLIPAIYLAVMFAMGRKRAMAFACIGVVFAGTIIALFVLKAVFSVPDMMADVEGNPCIFFFAVAMTTVLVHLLSRTFPGSIALFIGGSIVCAAVQFLYQWNLVLFTVGFIVCAVAMVVFKYYQRAYALADAKDAPRYGSAFVAGLATALVVVAVGSGLFFCIDAIAHPQALELKPFKEYFALEEVEVTGIANSTSVDDENKTSSNTNNNQSANNNKKDDDKDKENNKDQQGQGKPTEGTMVAYTAEAMDEAFEVISYSIGDLPFKLIIFLLVLLLIAPFVVKKVLRKRWHEAVLAKRPEEQVVDFYLFFLDGLDKIGLGKPASTTALSFAANSDASLRVLEENAGGVTLAEMSDAYTRCAYGAEPMTAETAKRFDQFYQAFYKGCRLHLGPFKYLLKFFKL